MGCLQGWILQGARDEHCQRALEPETGMPTSASHPWVLHRQLCCALPMQSAASEQMTGTLVTAKLPACLHSKDMGRQIAWVCRLRAQQKRRAWLKRTWQLYVPLLPTCCRTAAALQVSHNRSPGC